MICQIKVQKVTDKKIKTKHNQQPPTPPLQKKKQTPRKKNNNKKPNKHPPSKIKRLFVFDKCTCILSCLIYKVQV